MPALRISFATLLVCTSLAIAQSPDPIKAKLDKAQDVYLKEMTDYRQSVLDHFEEREAVARKAGNKKAVDQVKAEREAFEKNGQLPQVVAATFKPKSASIRAKLEAAYTVAVKEYTKEKLDKEAAAVEKSLAEFKSRFQDDKIAPASVTTKDDLRKFLSGSQWEWGPKENLTLKPDGDAHNPGWVTREGWSTRWDAVDRRTIVLVIVKGRNTDRLAVLVFSEDLASFDGFGFDSGRLRKVTPKK